jgi:hypothetical protein
LWRIEEMENKRLGYDETYENSKGDPEEEDKNAKEVDASIWLIYLLKYRGSARVEASCYDGSFKFKTLVDWIGKLERYFEYVNV